MSDKKSNKINKKMITMCTIALTTIYAGGFIATTQNQTSSSNTATNSQPAGTFVGQNTQTTVNDVQQNQNTVASNETVQTPSQPMNQAPNQTTMQPANTQSANVIPASIQVPKPQPATQTQSNVTPAKASAPALTTQQPITKPVQKQKYKDGVYTGYAENRIGGVEVAVTITTGKITKVEITNCTTSYPEDYISGLPQEAVQKQSSNVDTVSGATESTRDFRGAVQQALQKAEA